MPVIEEVLTRPKTDRRLLSNIPDPEQRRKLIDRRGFHDKEESVDPNVLYEQRSNGRRFMAQFRVRAVIKGRKNRKITLVSVDISNTGMLLMLPGGTESECWEYREAILKFRLPGGVMPEAYEGRVRIRAKVVRLEERIADDGTKTVYIAVQFEQPLSHYLSKRRWWTSVAMASLLILFIVLMVILMRAESVIYFKFNKFLYFYSIVTSVFLLSRYLFGVFYRNVPVNLAYEPGASIIIPVFNEEKWIGRTILSCMDQSYPIDQLEVIIVDDCSTDRTAERIRETIAKINREGNSRFKTAKRLKFHVLPENSGKRMALVEGVRMARHDLVVFVDSDSFLEPNAIRNLVLPFQDPKMGGVAGRTEVENKFTNALTKLQTVRYYIAFRIMKAAESWFDCVTCLSGPLSCYRKDLVLQNADAWLNQRFLGYPATFGDDRSMTNYILKTHRTGYQDHAICSTIVPSKTSAFLHQQMRWKRSWLRESFRALTFMWKKEPFMFLFFITGLIVPIAAPVIVLYNLIYVPAVHGVFPTTFLIGLGLMAMLMSFVYLYFRKSNLWFFGFIFVLYYVFILLWQMPVAWVTFWKSTWGTRETPQDVLAKEKKEERKRKRILRKKGDKVDG